MVDNITGTGNSGLENSDLIVGKRIAFYGKLGAFSKKEAQQFLKECQAEVVELTQVERAQSNVDWIVIGADELPNDEIGTFLTEDIRRQLRDGSTQLIHEHELWQKLGLVEHTQKQLYTPAMIAGFIKTPVRNVRRWHRMGLLDHTKVAHKLPYFDFEQLQNAKQLAAWIEKGARPVDIAKQLANFQPWVVKRSLIDLDLVVDGRRLLLRQGGQLLGANGQLHLDFDLLPEDTEDTLPIVLSSQPAFVEEVSEVTSGAAVPNDVENWKRDDLMRMAEELEDAGQLSEAIEWYRVILARYGLNAEVCFQLAELLYRQGDVTAARERYYNAIELDEDFVEARVNLGCVLAETGNNLLAIAAFQGVLFKDDGYPDVHYHLARCLDEAGQEDQADRHWLRFIQLAPQSPWAEEAIERLGR